MELSRTGKNIRRMIAAYSNVVLSHVCIARLKRKLKAVTGFCFFNSRFSAKCKSYMLIAKWHGSRQFSSFLLKATLGFCREIGYRRKPSKIFQIAFLTSRSNQTLLTCEAYFSELAASSSATHAVAKVVI